MQDELIKLLAGRRGHFRMESGYHGDRWFNLASLFAEQERLQPFLVELARRLRQHRVEAVCGPMTGGARLAQLIADELQATYLFTERFETSDAGLFPVRYLVPPALRETARGKRVAIVDDAVSAGSAVRGTHADLVACGALPVAIGALFIFGDAAAQFAAGRGLALEGVARMQFGLWRPEECPLCRAGHALESVMENA